MVNSEAQYLNAACSTVPVDDQGADMADRNSHTAEDDPTEETDSDLSFYGNVPSSFLIRNYARISVDAVTPTLSTLTEARSRLSYFQQRIRVPLQVLRPMTASLRGNGKACPSFWTAEEFRNHIRIHASTVSNPFGS
ncbi:UNVERIFIED_CONTAM: hypothetical protein PYX00_001106 [Menopon gallinae]|uniref:Uncharacterized protein n=1 Tax=Menopon gallinae TaxID=328185 RepID=A0AAW2IB40_9NEOP